MPSGPERLHVDWGDELLNNADSAAGVDLELTYGQCLDMVASTDPKERLVAAVMGYSLLESERYADLVKTSGLIEKLEADADGRVKEIADGLRWILMIEEKRTVSALDSRPKHRPSSRRSHPQSSAVIT